MGASGRHRHLHKAGFTFQEVPPACGLSQKRLKPRCALAELFDVNQGLSTLWIDAPVLPTDQNKAPRSAGRMHVRRSVRCGRPACGHRVLNVQRLICVTILQLEIAGRFLFRFRPSIKPTQKTERSRSDRAFFYKSCFSGSSLPDISFFTRRKSRPGQ